MRPLNPSSAEVPSRVKYRLQRLLLARSFSLFLRIFLPVAAVTGIAFGALAWSGYDIRLNNLVSTLLKTVKNNPEFMISGVTFQGASPHTEKEIRALLPPRFPVSPFEIDVKELKQSVEELPAAVSASVALNPSGYVEIVVVERAPALIWRNEFDLLLLDSDGRVVGNARRRLDYPELMLVAGAGADAAVPEAMQIISAAKPIAEMIRGLVRVGERRWNLELDRSRTLMLPEQEPSFALARLLELDSSEGILSKSISIIDLRNSERMTVRLAESALEKVRSVGS